MIELLVLVLFAGLVGVRRLQARRTSSDLTPPPGDVVFAKIWLQTRTPRASMRAYRDRLRGSLTVGSALGVVRFESKKDGSVDLSPVRTVRMGGRGTDFVNTWIEVSCGAGPNERSLYLNDGGWFGWRPILTGSNRRIAQTLSAVSSSAQGPPAASP